MKYRFIRTKKGVDIMQDPDGKNTKIGSAENLAGATEKLRAFLNKKP